MFNKVFWSAKLDKKIAKLPNYVRDKFHYWVDLIELIGINEVRKIKSFHDEPLKGILEGKRAIRLNRAYRSIYLVHNDKLKTIEVLEINKHEYKK